MRSTALLFALSTAGAGLAGCPPSAPPDGGDAGDASAPSVTVPYAITSAVSFPAVVRAGAQLLAPAGANFVEQGDAGSGLVRVSEGGRSASGNCELRIDRAMRSVALSYECFGNDAAPLAVAHALGHALGMQDICAAAGAGASCSPVGAGPALMNSSGSAAPDPSAADVLVEDFGLVAGHPMAATALDRQEFARTR